MKVGDRIICKDRSEIRPMKTWLYDNGIRTRKVTKSNTLVVREIMDEEKAKNVGLIEDKENT